jgi:hypothetical protein
MTAFIVSAEQTFFARHRADLAFTPAETTRKAADV